jgi:transcriptional antiterminator RfaH
MDAWPKWFAVLCGPRSEQEASVNLRRAGFRVFYPHVREIVRVKQLGTARRLRQEVERPLFPRYIFVALRDAAEGLYAVKGLRGVSCIVRLRFSGVPLQIPNCVMNRIIDWADGEGLVPTAKALHWFRGKPGDSVEIKDGPLDGLITCIASVDALDRTDEVSVWVKMLGAEHQVSVPASSVKVIAAVPA